MDSLDPSDNDNDTEDYSESSTCSRGHVHRQHRPHVYDFSEDEIDDDDEEPLEPRDVRINRDRRVDSFYDLLEILGKGKFGVVYKCREKATSRHFAAKFIDIRHSQERKDVETEIELMNDLRHPRLLQLYDAFDDGKRMTIIMELATGGELFSRVIDDKFVLTEKVCTVFMRQICEGVEYMHSRSVVHLDLKPENVLCVTPTGNRIKLIDFGLARRYSDKEDIRVLFGTPEFVAPEVIGYDRISLATDMWSVGVICYILLSGLSPFMGDNDVETLSNVTNAAWDFEDECFDAISEDARDFITQLLVKRPEKRMSATQCLKHKWLKQSRRRSSILDPEDKSLSKAKLRRFVIRRRWQKVFNTIRALRRMGSCRLDSPMGNPENEDDTEPVDLVLAAGGIADEPAVIDDSQPELDEIASNASSGLPTGLESSDDDKSEGSVKPAISRQATPILKTSAEEATATKDSSDLQSTTISKSDSSDASLMNTAADLNASSSYDEPAAGSEKTLVTENYKSHPNPTETTVTQAEADSAAINNGSDSMKVSDIDKSLSPERQMSTSPASSKSASPVPARLPEKSVSFTKTPSPAPPERQTSPETRKFLFPVPEKGLTTSITLQSSSRANSLIERSPTPESLAGRIADVKKSPSPVPDYQKQSSLQFQDSRRKFGEAQNVRASFSKSPSPALASFSHSSSSNSFGMQKSCSPESSGLKTDISTTETQSVRTQKTTTTSRSVSHSTSSSASSSPAVKRSTTVSPVNLSVFQKSPSPMGARSPSALKAGTPPLPVNRSSIKDRVIPIELVDESGAAEMPAGVSVTADVKEIQEPGKRPRSTADSGVGDLLTPGSGPSTPDMLDDDTIQSTSPWEDSTATGTAENSSLVTQTEVAVPKELPMVNAPTGERIVPIHIL